MAMGSISRVVIDNEMQKAKQDCQTFRTEVAAWFQELEGTVTSLLNSGFKGEAAEGFKAFFDNNVKAFFAPGGAFDQFMGMFDKEGEGLFDAIQKTLIGGEGLDPSLGENNRNIGKSSDGQ